MSDLVGEWQNTVPAQTPMLLEGLSRQSQGLLRVCDHGQMDIVEAHAMIKAVLSAGALPKN
ncbi:MAG: hypothetical protein WA634_16720 [Silvibacterium sp.]